MSSIEKIAYDAAMGYIGSGLLSSYESIHDFIRDVVGHGPKESEGKVADAIAESLGKMVLPVSGPIEPEHIASLKSTKPATAPKPTPVAPPPVPTVVPHPSTLAQVGTLEGASAPKLMEDASGKRFVVKTDTNHDRLKNEADADAAYRALGIKTAPTGDLVSSGPGDLYKVTEFVHGSQTLKEWEKGKTPEQVKEMYRKVGKGFVADALLANWDVVGAHETNKKNIIVKDDEPYRIDNGGALKYRGAGELKGSKFADTVGELKTLRDATINPSTHEIFNHLTDAEIKDQVKAILPKRDAVLNTISDPATKETVSKRFDHLEALAGSKATPTQAGQAVAAASTPHNVQAPPPHPPGSQDGNPLHTASGLIQHLWDNKGDVPLSPLLLVKLHALNPEGIKNGVFKVTQLPKGEKNAQDKLALFSHVLPAGTVIKHTSLKDADIVGKYGAMPPKFGKITSLTELHQYLGDTAKPAAKLSGSKPVAAKPLDAVPKPGVVPKGDFAAEKAAWEKLGLPQVKDGKVTFEAGTYKVSQNEGWAKSLTSPEKSAISTWKGSAKEIRKTIEEGNPSPEAKAFLSALSKAEDFEGVVYRGIHDKYAIELAKEIKANGVGSVWSDPAPHCTSVNSHPAANFSYGDLMFRMSVKTAKPIMASDDFSDDSPTAEKEVVGQPGTKYRVMAIHENVKMSGAGGSHGSVKYFIDLQEV